MATSPWPGILGESPLVRLVLGSEDGLMAEPFPWVSFWISQFLSLWEKRGHQEPDDVASLSISRAHSDLL